MKIPKIMLIVLVCALHTVHAADRLVQFVGDADPLRDVSDIRLFIKNSSLKNIGGALAERCNIRNGQPFIYKKNVNEVSAWLTDFQTALTQEIATNDLLKEKLGESFKAEKKSRRAKAKIASRLPIGLMAATGALTWCNHKQNDYQNIQRNPLLMPLSCLTGALGAYTGFNAYKKWRYASDATIEQERLSYRQHLTNVGAGFATIKALIENRRDGFAPAAAPRGLEDDGRPSGTQRFIEIILAQNAAHHETLQLQQTNQHAEQLEAMRQYHHQQQVLLQAPVQRGLNSLDTEQPGGIPARLQITQRSQHDGGESDDDNTTMLTSSEPPTPTRVASPRASFMLDSMVMVPDAPVPAASDSPELGKKSLTGSPVQEPTISSSSASSS